MAFQPARASSPFHEDTIDTIESITAAITRTSTAPISEFKNLTPRDVRIIDDIIQRAGPSATTFLAIFRAYDDILLEHALDPHEVAYYGKLLKLGTIKSKTWGEKWAVVKRQYGYTDGEQDAPALQSAEVSTKGFAKPHAAKDTFVPITQQDDSEFHLSETDTGADLLQYHQSPRFIPHASSSITRTNSLGLDILPPDQPRFFLGPQVGHPKQDAWPSTSSEDGKTLYTLPSYGAAMRDTPSLALPRPQAKRDRLLASPALTASAARQAVAKARERRGNIINEEDAWNKIKMSQDEKEADRFRDDRIVERCWNVWRQALEWFRTTNEQMGQARDCHLVRLTLHHWRTLASSRMQLYQRVTHLANERRLRTAFNFWLQCLQERRRARWQQGMREKMKIVREKWENKLQKDAWAKWRQLYQSHLSRQHYAERLIRRFYQRWKNRLFLLDHMDTAADIHLSGIDRRVLVTTWKYWRREVEIKLMERAISERVCLRLMGDVMNVWKRHLDDKRTSDSYYEFILKKRAIRSWKTSRDRIRNLNNRALKHLARQNIVLLSAVTRVWRARERAKLLERVKSVRLMKYSWMTWTRRMQYQKRRQDLAIAYSSRLNASFVSSVFHKWREILSTHRNANAFAVLYYSKRVRFNFLFAWRIQLRLKMKMAKKARAAERLFVTRRAWRTLTAKFEACKREKKLQEFKKRQVQKCFHVWLQCSRRKIHHKLTEQKIQSRIDQRITRSALTKWTNRVIEIKLRELDVTQRKDSATLAAAFKQWKAVCVRHVEELSLMESYRFVKREENIRRIFYHWLSAARASRHRRVTLQRKEAEVELGRLATAWDKWRERFLNEKLRPLELEILVQSRNNLLFRMFGIWHSKTRSLPAIRFHASHLKAKSWRIWRATMPRALQAKKARDNDRQTILAKALDKWSQTYKTKIALKAVARARYLRLPTAAPRPVAQSRPITINNPPGHKMVNAISSDDERAGPSRPRFPFGPTTPKLTTATRPRSEAGFSRAGFSDKADEPSTTGFKASVELSTSRRGDMTSAGRPHTSTEQDLGRNKLWQELKQVRGRSRPSTAGSRSRSREPP